MWKVENSLNFHIDVAITNAYILHRGWSGSTTKFTMKKLRVRLAKDIILLHQTQDWVQWLPNEDPSYLTFPSTGISRKANEGLMYILFEAEEKKG